MLSVAALALSDVAGGVLAVAGLIKLFDPAPWVASLGGLGLPVRTRRARRSAAGAARLVGLAEVVIALAVVVVGGQVTLGLLASAYVAFAVVALLAWRRGGTPCGCFGSRSAPISGLHVGLNLAIALVAIAAATFDDPGSLVARLDDGAGATLGYLVFLGLGVAAMVTAMTTGAELLELRRSVTPLAAEGSR